MEKQNPAPFPDLPPDAAPNAAPNEPADETDAFAQRVQAIPAQRWKLYNILCGIVLGLLLGVCIFILPTIDEFSNWSLILAAVLALLVPRFVENKLNRSIAVGRITMVAVFAATLIGQLLYGLLGGGLS